MKKLGTGIAIFGVAVLVASLLVGVFTAEKPSPDDGLKTYVITEPYEVNAFTIWKPNTELVAVNKTHTEYLGFFKLIYNETSQEMRKIQFDAWVLNFTTNQVYQNESATQTIQWAIDNGQRIEFTGGNYTLTQTIGIAANNFELIGNGAWFRASENFTGNYLFHISSDYSYLSGINIDGSNLR
jgi:hypothetical protein